MAFLAPARNGTQFPPAAAPLALATVGLAALALTAFGLLHPAPAFAHHPMGLLQLTPGPWVGLLSGLAHPLLGPDHLLFLLAIGLVAWSRPWGWGLALLAAGLVGNGIGLLLPGLPGLELLVALSLVATGLVVARRWPAPLLIPLYIAHGAVFSDAVIGWASSSIVCYLLGLLISQALLLLLAFTLVRRWRSVASDQTLTLVAGLFIGLGLAFSWTVLIP